MNIQTHRQLTAIILIDCISQCNAMQVERAEYERQLRAMLRERLGDSGQRELPI